MSITSDQMELREEEIRKHYGTAMSMLEGFDHTPRIAHPQETDALTEPERSPGIARMRRLRSTTPGLVTRSTARPDGVHLRRRIESTDADEPLVSPLQATVQHQLRRALAIALAVGDAFSSSSGLAELKRANLAGTLNASRRAEFTELLAAEALAVLHVFGNATAFLLAPHASEVQVEVGEVEEVLTDNAQLALHGTLWELDQKLAIHAHDDARLIATLAAFAEQVMERVTLRAQNAPRLASFSDVVWRIEADDLTLRGFEPATKAKSSTLTMTFKKPHEVVGNHIAKYQALRLAKMLMAYDFERRLNPFAEMGGFIFTFMGDGKPGTGKTTLIQMMAGLLHEYCQVAGYPFRYQNFGIDNIDSYQGKSGQNAKAFINALMDPGVIGFGTVDDIDQIAGKRGDRQSSAGQQEVTAVLMDAFAGANTLVRGNCTFGMFSNYPENVDDALRQRSGARFLVDGPQTREDYIDVLHLLLGGNHEIPLGEHDLYAAQEIKQAVARSFESHNRPQEDMLLAVFDRVHSRVGELDTIAKLGSYLKAIQEADERFTGRAVKNITDAVKVRSMDFELPDEWMENPELFLFKDYATKTAMIAELRVPITTEMVLQEINRYADSEFRYAGKSDDAAIETMVRELSRQEEAKRRYLEERTA
ncbi:AAA family ATPase [Billgrantia tianxiuensis]|jgi:energy-coupling factor transporter ATP-binding protein EcfA2|uniref:AAA family ATPase n=2 Tax=Bacteria TaxID=2 RepID=A0A6I6SK38_9GAMM|nr:MULTISPECIES: ATP-binding protein [Halomonas]MCE8034082.1 AAA family ATPase [Halomonas sp. MCCC 1A11057]QHC51068.1 AAA family ATPase [Halomonas tianxiuensis]